MAPNMKLADLWSCWTGDPSFIGYIPHITSHQNSPGLLQLTDVQVVALLQPKQTPAAAASLRCKEIFTASEVESDVESFLVQTKTKKTVRIPWHLEKKCTVYNIINIYIYHVLLHINIYIYYIILYLYNLKSTPAVWAKCQPHAGLGPLICPPILTEVETCFSV